MSTTRGAGEIETGRVIHRADVPRGSEESFVGLTGAAECAKCEGKSRKQKCASKPREELGEVSPQEESYACTRANEDSDRQTGEKTCQKLARQNIGARKEQRASAEARFPRAHRGHDEYGPNPRGTENLASRYFEWRGELRDQQ